MKVQKENGVRLIDGTNSTHSAREFISEIAEAIREKLAIILCNATAFSLLTDGSQARKTGAEKELVMVKTVRNGLPVYYVVALQDIDEFADATADNLKAFIDAAFKGKLKIPGER